VVTIVLILAGLLFGVMQRLPGAADRVRCSQNLKELYVGLSNYTEDNNHWPQCPPLTYDQQNQIADFWINTLKPYGVTDAVWQCPGIQRLGKIQQVGHTPRMHYSPTQFDDKPGTPRKWPNQPWVVEIANVHGHGPLLIRSDGSVHDWDTYIEQFVK
jgi:hypothetical protein